LESNTEEDDNKEYSLKQERTAIQETKAVFPPLRQRIEDALFRLEDQVAAGEGSGATDEEISKAKEVIQSAKKAVKEIK